MAKRKRISQIDLLFQYYQDRPHRDIPHAEIVDWATAEWLKLTGEVFRDPDRGIRRLYQDGKLVKVKKGVYRYEPDLVGESPTSDAGFSATQKEAILRAGKYRCAICGATEESGAELHIDHIKPQMKGGKSEISNGQVLCSEHNMRKKFYNQTETGKMFFINLLNLAKSYDDSKLIAFVEDVLRVYEAHHINSHIDWDQTDETTQL